MLRSEVIGKFLGAKTHADLSALYSPGMEVQVNVEPGNGRKIDVSERGTAYSDGIETWYSFRIPRKAMSNPEGNDTPQNFDFEKHVSGIGLTGWNWQLKQSHWVAYDFDAMIGHSDKHTSKLSDQQLLEIQKIVTNLPFVTIRRSTSGRGLHLYVHIEPISTATHTEHAALARSILSYITGLTGYNFGEAVDICGGNMWVWHRKMIGTNGLSLIRKGDVFPASRVPHNWKDHVAVISKKSSKLLPKIEGVSEDAFQEMTGCRTKVQLGPGHVALINWLSQNGYAGWWDSDNHMLITHTYSLKEAHQKLKLKGEFDTLSTGKDNGNDINCYCFPVKEDGWAVRRYGPGTKESKLWVQDGKGWTRCYLNRTLSFDDIARMYDAIELETGGYQFPSCEKGCEALLKLGISVELPKWVMPRIMKIVENKQEYRLYVRIPEVSGDPVSEMVGWVNERKFYRRVFGNPLGGANEDVTALGDYDDLIRHIVTESGEDLGWVIHTDDGNWRYEPLPNVKVFLVSRGIGKKDIDIILGRAVNQAWRIVNRPFEPEYPGDRQWNRSTARFKICPTLDGESLSYPTWCKVLNHCGKSLDTAISEHKWCQQNGITDGASYLKLWIASLFKHPRAPLPYLGLYGPQDSGKSTLHEALCQIILDGGYMDGAIALESQSNFNGEIQDSILCTVEEVDFRNKNVYNRIKNWVTSAEISIHIKGQTPYKANNYTHWIHCANDRDYIPVFPGDTRVTMLYVDKLSDEDKIPKRDLWTALTKEAPDFLAALLATEIPDSKDRLMVPVIRTAEKIAAEYSAMDPVEQWFVKNVYRVEGAYLKLEDAYQAFCAWTDPEVSAQYGKNKFAKVIPSDVPQGRIASSGTQLKYLGNVSLNPLEMKSGKWIEAGLFLKRTTDMKE
jgi:hypothetical protein